jgi:hypothetical protein
MSLKLPRKSKAQNTIYSDESDEENDQQKNKSIRKTEPLKRKRYTRNQKVRASSKKVIFGGVLSVKILV